MYFVFPTSYGRLINNVFFQRAIPINTVIDILEIADSETFVLIDELCAGTDPQEGAVLAEVILKELVKKQARSICFGREFIPFVGVTI